jgi:lipopolysaccharide transport system permease protein
MIETVISIDRKVRINQYLKDLWNYRDLFRALIERDIKTRYKQTVFGVLWVIVPPLINSGVFYIIFVRVVEMPTQDLPPLLFFLSALIPWNCFSNGISQAANSLAGSAGLITKVYFPRIIVPVATVLSTVFDFLIGWLFFNGVAIYYGCWTWLFIPFTVVLLILQVITSIGIGVVLAALNAQYRDIRYVLPWLIQLGMWITPVVWPMKRLLATRFGNELEMFLYFNPMVGVIEAYRALLVSGAYFPYKLLYKLLICNLIVGLILFFVGVFIFRRREQRIVDLL